MSVWPGRNHPLGATWSEDLPLVMTRNGYEETAYFTFSLHVTHFAPKPTGRLSTHRP